MPPSGDEMHGIAMDKAVQFGPRVWDICGNQRVAYGLTKRELMNIFKKNNYNPIKNSKWRTAIGDWIDPSSIYFDRATIRNTSIIQDKKEQSDWSIVFCLVPKGDLTSLKMRAESVGIHCWPNEEMWQDAQERASVYD